MLDFSGIETKHIEQQSVLMDRFAEINKKKDRLRQKQERTISESNTRFNDDEELKEIL